MLMLIFCAAAAAAVGALVSHQTKWHGLLLMFCWVVTAVVQYFNNINFEEHELPPVMAAS